ncbi:hypothetical protein ABZ726_01570 [Streptomyces hundungensis]|uniref:hypothetical protein n=1 Tax=Streptomyces hundungensis TaxID=1077946 RepID=UPI0033CFF873
MQVIFETGDDDELNGKLLDLVSAHTETVTVADAVWTPDRADQLLTEINGRARTLLRAITEGEGWVDGEEFRKKYGDNAVQGPTTSITTAVKRGIREGWLPEDAELPLESTYDGRSSWQKTGGYRLPRHLAGIFRDAFARVYPAVPPHPDTVMDHLAELYEWAGREPELARERARAFLDQHADALAAWALARRITGDDAQ